MTSADATTPPHVLTISYLQFVEQDALNEIDEQHGWVTNEITPTEEQRSLFELVPGDIYRLPVEALAAVMTPHIGICGDLVVTILHAINENNESHGTVPWSIFGEPIIINWRVEPTVRLPQASPLPEDASPRASMSYHLEELGRLILAGELNADTLVSRVCRVATALEPSIHGSFMLVIEGLYEWLGACYGDHGVFIDRLTRYFASTDEVENSATVTQELDTRTNEVIYRDVFGNPVSPPTSLVRQEEEREEAARQAAMDAIQAGTYQRPVRLNTTSDHITPVVPVQPVPEDQLLQPQEPGNYRITQHTPTGRWHVRYTHADGCDRLLANVEGPGVARAIAAIADGVNLHLGVYDGCVTYVSVPDPLAPFFSCIEVNWDPEAAGRVVRLPDDHEARCRWMVVSTRAENNTDLAARVFDASPFIILPAVRRRRINDERYVVVNNIHCML